MSAYRGSQRLREVCGFLDKVPTESTMSRFVTKLTDHLDLIEQILISGADELRNLVPTTMRKPYVPGATHNSAWAVGDLADSSDDRLPRLGEVVAVDSTLFPSYSNPNRRVVSDPDARGGINHSSKAMEGGQEWGWGYKQHLLSDVTHGAPLAMIVTPANQSESNVPPALVRKAEESHPWLKIGYLIADRGYDSQANHRFSVDRGIVPVIHIRRPSKGKLHQGVYSTMGAPTCLGKVEMEYVRTDPENGHHLFRCPKTGCHLLKKGTKPLRHCDHEVWEDPMANLRVVGVLSRLSPEWKKLYR